MKPLRLLFATDGSANAQAALACVQQLDWAADSTADILVVADKHAGIGHLDQKQAEVIGNGAQSLLEARFPGRTRLILRSGSAKEAIAGSIAADKPDLLAMGAHSRANVLQQAMLGSVADTLVKTAGVNFLIAKAGRAEQFHRVLVCLSSEAQALGLLAAMRIVPWPPQAEFTFVHVFAPPDTEYTPSPDRDNKFFKKGQARSKSEAEAFLQKCKEKLQSSGITSPIAMQVIEDLFPPACIVETSKQLGADVIVLGKREHVGLDGFLLGSVSREVAHAAPAHVLLAQSAG